MIAVIVVQLLKSYKLYELIKILFFNKDNEFQWVGVTAIVGVITFLLTYILTLRKNKADLVSQSRTEWIQDVKN